MALSLGNAPTAQRHYERGNDLFRFGDYEGATTSYSQCIDECKIYMKCNFDAGYGAFDVMTERDWLIKAISNRAMCHINLRNYESAVLDCSVVLRTQPNNWKILLRRAKAQQCLGNFCDSLADIEIVMAGGNMVPISLFQQALQLRRETLDLSRRDEVVRSAQPIPPSFINKEQCIKLVFTSSHIDRLMINRPFQYRIGLSNVFGLFDRSLMSGGTELFIKATVVELSLGNTRTTNCYEVINVGTDKIGLNGKVDFEFILKATMPEEYSHIRVVLIRFECIGALASGHTIIPISTLPSMLFTTPEHADAAEQCHLRWLLESSRNIGAECIREIDVFVPSTAKDLGLKSGSWERFRGFECPGSLCIAGKIWESAYALLHYMQRNPQFIRGKTVIELGSGTGLAGIALATLSPKLFYLSDMPETVPLLNANISLNVDVIESYKPPDFNQISGVPGPGPCFSHNYCAIGWMWGCEVFSYALGTNGAQSLVSAHAIENAPIIDVLRRCDLAVASDVVYDPSGYEPLLASIIAFLRADTDPSPERMFIMAHRHRNPEDYRFFDALRASPGVVVHEEAFITNVDETFSSQALANDVKVYIVSLAHDM